MANSNQLLGFEDTSYICMNLDYHKENKGSAGCFGKISKRGYGMFNVGLNPAQPAKQELQLL